MLRPYLVKWYLGFCKPCGVILAGMALYVHLMFYMGLSLFIIRRAYVYLVVCVLTRITLQNAAEIFTYNTILSKRVLLNG